MDPPFDMESVLKTTDPIVLSQNRSAIRQYIRHASAKLVQLQAQCDELRTNIETLERKTPSIGLLSEDVLQYIFTLCLPTSHNATMLASDAPVLLTHVCAKWRSLAMATPQLWSSLHLYTHHDSELKKPFMPGTSLQERDRRVVEWIKRAQSCKLSLSFGGGYSDRRTRRSEGAWIFGDRRVKEYVPLGNAKDLKRLLLLLLPYFSQWDNITMILSGPRRDVETFFLQETLQWKKKAPLTSVRTFGLWLEFDGNVGATTQSVPQVVKSLGLGSAPQLRDLAIYSNGHLDPDDFSTDSMPNTLRIEPYIPWSQLRRLNLQVPLAVPYGNMTPGLVIEAEDILEILSQCPDLVAFTANVLQSEYDEPIEPRPTILNERLKSLSLNFKYEGDLDLDDEENGGLPLDFAKYCRWPALAALKLNYNVPSTPAVTECIRKVGATLTSLSLDACYAIDLEILSLLPVLAQLSLETQKVPNECSYELREQSGDLLEYLTPPDDDTKKGSTGYCCPLLQYLKWERTATFDDEVFMVFLQRRATLQTAMKQVHIEFGRAAQADLLLACGALIERGLDLKVSYWTGDPDKLKYKRDIPGFVAKAGILPARHFGDDFGWD